MKEIRIRIEKKRALLINKKRFLLLTAQLYGTETMITALMKKVEAFQMWTYRCLLRICWTDHVTKVEVLRHMGKEKKVITIKRKKFEYSSSSSTTTNGDWKS